MKHLPLFSIGALLGAACLAAQAQSQAMPPRANLNVTPLSLGLNANETATQMLIRNQGEDLLAIQLRVFEWTQINGEDHYAEAVEIVISPSIVRIEPGRAQSFHILSRGARQRGREGRYRVVIDELPGSSTASSGTAQTRLRLTLPLFTDRDTATASEPVLIVRPGSLIIGNSGGRTLRLTNLAIEADGEALDLGEEAALQYVLGGSWVSIPLPGETACAASEVRVSAQADEGAINAIAQQDCP